MQLKLKCVPEKKFQSLVMESSKCYDYYVDENLYVVCKPGHTEEDEKVWFNLCSKSSNKRIKLVVLHSEDVPENSIYSSETMKHNICKVFDCREHQPSFFFVPLTQEPTQVVAQAKISQISSTHRLKEDMVSRLLHNYFLVPRYLRVQDIFRINLMKYIPEIKYQAAFLNIKNVYFVVNDIINSEKTSEGFVVHGKSALFLESNIQSFLPEISDNLVSDRNNSSSESSVRNNNFVFDEVCLNHLLRSIKPFLNAEFNMNLKPIFLIEGPDGCGKTTIVKGVANTLGLHLLDTDITELQSLTSAQTEAKLDIALSAAEECRPCIIMFRNMQVFGVNSEGHIDDRLVSSFIQEIQKLYRKKHEFPMIVIALTNKKNIPIGSKNIFIERFEIKPLQQEDRCQTLSHFVRRKHFKTTADLSKISKISSDFTSADLDVMILNAIKRKYNELALSEDESLLTHEDLANACENTQLMFADQIGAPKIPQVHWEDIGGLNELKHEIIRRIEIPLFKSINIKKSGILLYGPPGTGKTMLAKAVATEYHMHFLSVKGPELLNMYVGQSEENVRQVFEKARAASPCIIFFDELDSLAPKRGFSGDSGGVMDRVVSQLLAEMDGLESSGSIILMGATNRPDLLDVALLRPGRFDKMLYIGIYSDMSSKLSILEALTRQVNIDDRTLLSILAKKLPQNLTGADMYAVCSNAWLQAVKRIFRTNLKEEEEITAEDVILNLDDFMVAAQSLVPSVTFEEILRYEELRKEFS